MTVTNNPALAPERIREVLDIVRAALPQYGSSYTTAYASFKRGFSLPERLLLGDTPLDEPFTETIIELMDLQDYGSTTDIDLIVLNLDDAGKDA